jgi:hypothetical protein
MKDNSVLKMAKRWNNIWSAWDYGLTNNAKEVDKFVDSLSLRNRKRVKGVLRQLCDSLWVPGVTTLFCRGDFDYTGLELLEAAGFVETLGGLSPSSRKGSGAIFKVHDGRNGMSVKWLILEERLGIKPE